MFDSYDVAESLAFMSDNKKKNLDEIRMCVISDLDYISDHGYTLLHFFVDDTCFNDEPQRLQAIQSLLDYGLNPNDKDITGQNFIQTAMYDGTTDQFILQLISEALKYGLKVNHQDCSGNTIMHSAVFSDYYDVDDLASIYNLLIKNGFNKNLCNKMGMNIVQSMNFSGNYSHDEIKLFQDMIGVDMNKDIKLIETQATKDLKELEKYGMILNNKNYLFEPAIGREQEIFNLMLTLAKEQENPIIVGNSGVGKSVLCEELVYLIQNNKVPKFLKDKTVIETSPSSLVSGCEHVGQFEAKLHKFLELCQKHGVILVINEIHNIYGTGASKSNDTDMAEILKSYLDTPDFKIIGTTTYEEYDKYFANSSLKRRFGKVEVKEPSNKVLKTILLKRIKDYLEYNHMKFEYQDLIPYIVNIIVDTTTSKHRIYNDIEYNPALSLSIIDTAFAVAKVNDSEIIKIDYFIEAINSNMRIYEGQKKMAINQLKELKWEKDIPKKLTKILDLKK